MFPCMKEGLLMCLGAGGNLKKKKKKKIAIKKKSYTYHLNCAINHSLKVNRFQQGCLK